MNPNSQKNQQLIKQYPFVSDILKQWMQPFAGGNKPGGILHVDDLTIKVEKADGDLMFRRADNVGLGDSSCIFQLKGNRNGQVMRRGEYAFTTDKDGKIINRLDFPRNDEERRKSLDEVYAWWVLWKSRELNASGTGYLHSGCLWKETKYIVWVTVEAWHTDTKNDDEPGSRFGEFLDRSVHITIYGEPDCGFEKLQEQSSLVENLFLDSRVIMRGAGKGDSDILCISGRLDELCRLFQDEVYFNGMKEVLDKGECRGAFGQFGSVKVMCGKLCGYDRVMLEDADSWISFQLRPDSKTMYVLGMAGTLPRLRSLVKSVVKLWNEKPELREAFKPDSKISVM